MISPGTNESKRKSGLDYVCGLYMWRMEKVIEIEIFEGLEFGKNY